MIEDACIIVCVKVKGDIFDMSRQIIIIVSPHRSTS